MPRNNLVATLLVWILFSSGNAVSGETGPNTGTISFVHAIIITPDTVTNRLLRENKIDPQSVVEVRIRAEGLVVNPILRDGWTWVAAKGIEVDGRPLAFMFLDGRLYSDVMLKTLHRRVKFQKDVSGSIQTGGFVLAFYREYAI